MLMAGLDGIQNKIEPPPPVDKDLYDLEPEEAKHIPQVCHSLDMALEELDKDREFLELVEVYNHMLDRLAWSEMFESFLASKYTAAKRFGLEVCAHEPNLGFNRV